MSQATEKPRCRVERGYDTHVKVLPNHERELSRSVRVVCAWHDVDASETFDTYGKTGKEIMEVQHVAFDRCFNAVMEKCYKLLGES